MRTFFNRILACVIINTFLLMKLSTFLFAVLFISFKVNTKDQRKLVFLFYQQEGERPIGNSKEVFWDNKDYYDTITISSGNLISRIESRLKTLTPVYHEISYHAAVIRYKNDIIVDTIYANRFLSEWEIGGHIFRDKSGILTKMFVNFFNAQLD
jgi:hypothetical protein